MSNFRRQAADALGELIYERCRGLVRERPVIISANPSEVADYPRVAITMEKFPLTMHHEDELMVDSQGELLVGARAGLDVEPSGAASITAGDRLSKIGTFRGFGRIWVGCRLHPKREEVEHAIATVFVQDEAALGRLLVDIPKPRIGHLELPWPWTAAFFMEEQHWSEEHAFEERVWSFTNFDVELDFLAVRSSPLVRRFLLEVNAHVPPPGQSETLIIEGS